MGATESRSRFHADSFFILIHYARLLRSINSAVGQLLGAALLTGGEININSKLLIPPAAIDCCEGSLNEI